MILTHHGISSLSMEASPSTRTYVRTVNPVTGTYKYLNYLPALTAVKYSMSQQIVKGSEIAVEGKITDLKYYVSTAISSNRSMKIYMQYTDDEMINEHIQSTIVSADTLVYDGNYSLSSGLQTIHLDTPFEYDGIHNLMLTFVDNTGTTPSAATIRSKASQSTTVMAGYAVSSDAPFDVTTTIYQMNSPVDANARSDLTLAIECLINIGTVTIGGRDYNTIETNGKIWMTENLDYVYPGCTLSTAENPIPANSTTTTPTCWYYNNDVSYKTPCGLLYNRPAAEGLVNDIGGGWRLPTQEDWTALTSFVAFYNSNASALKSTDNAYGAWPTNWGGDDIIGFSMIPGGYASNTGFFKYGEQGSLICNIEDGWVPGRYTTRLSFNYNDKNLVRVNGSDGYDAYSLRLVKDA